MELASSAASASSAKLWSVEHRSEDLALDDLGVVGLGLDQRRLVPEARLWSGRSPPKTIVSPFTRARFTNPSTRAR